MFVVEVKKKEAKARVKQREGEQKDSVQREMQSGGW